MPIIGPILALMLALALLPLAVSAEKSAAPWWTPAPRIFKAEEVDSFRTVLQNSGDEADVYHPVPYAKEDGLYVNRFPVVVLLQGALVDKEFYSTFGMHLSRYGFIVVIPNHPRAIGGGGEPALFAEVTVITDALEQMRVENIDPTSPVYGITDTNTLAISGHSFGGAAAISTIANVCSFPFCDPASGFTRPVELKAAALVSTNSRGFDPDTTGIPVAITYGDEERGAADVEATFELFETPKALFTVRGTNHFGVNDVGQPPGSNFERGEPLQEVPQSISAFRFAHWSGLFLRAHLHLDWNAYTQIYKSTADYPGVTVTSQYK